MMASIFSVDKNNNITHQIDIDEKFVIRDDDFISIEIGGGFDWNRHAMECGDCKAFIDSLGKDTYKWILKSGNEHFLLMLDEFGHQKEYLKNLFSLINSTSFYGTRAKFKKIRATIEDIDNLRIEFEADEQYENCAELRNTIKYLKGQ